MQTQGPPVNIEGLSEPVAHFVVPEGAGQLGFLLIAGSASGLELATLSIPIEGRGKAIPAGLRADAGDDQFALVGRQVTLNGIRSEPRGDIGYRWIQIAGPPVSLKIEDGYIYTFIPNEPGLYRFALVVAMDDVISEPDTVDVLVEAGRSVVPTPPAPPALSLQELAATSLTQVEGGRAAARALAEAFEAVAERADLYESYSSMLKEMERRLEQIVPQDPARRAEWTQRVFMPLTVRLVDRLRAEGLDLLRADGQHLPLTQAQKDRLAEQLRTMARGFRSLEPRP